MTIDETTRVIAALRRLWPHSHLGDDPRAVLTTWHSLLEQFPVDDVEAAIRELAVAGREFAPPPGLVVQTVTSRLLDAPDFDEAWTEIDRAIRSCGRQRPPIPGTFSHPLIDAFTIPAWVELCNGPAPGTNGFGTHYAQQREAYKALRARQSRDVSLIAIGAPRTRRLARSFDQVLTDATGPVQLEPGREAA